jgi:hypothetical protein
MNYITYVAVCHCPAQLRCSSDFLFNGSKSGYVLAPVVKDDHFLKADVIYAIDEAR